MGVSVLLYLDGRSGQPVPFKNDLVVREFLDISGKSISPSWNRFDKIGFAELLKGFPERINIVGKICLLDEGVIPYLMPYFVL
jgi:hypothetical protein